MRIRHKKWARPELEKCEYFLENPKQNKGIWKEQFKKEQPIYLELGCGKGDFISKLASQNPNINYIAMDIKCDMLGYVRRKVEEEYAGKEVDNLLIVAQNIEQILDIMDEKDEIDRLYINFCNPWPRPKHKKKRLTHTRQLEKYKVFLKDGAEVYFKTDDDELFAESIKYFDESGFEILKMTYDLHKEPIWENNIETEHEKMFSEEGIKIKALIAKLK